MFNPDSIQVENKPAGDFEKIRSGLLGLSRLKQAEKEKNIPYQDIIGELPEKMQKSVLDSVERFRGYGLTEEQLTNEVRIRVDEIKTSYIDKRFDLPNESYLRLEIAKRIDEVISDEPAEDHINGIGLLSFDVNGLKAVNDIAGHSAGNEYLKRIAEVFKNGQTTNKLKKQNIGVFLAAGGGDEFSLFLSGKKDLIKAAEAANDKRSILEMCLAEYTNEISSIDCSDLLDFSKKEVADKFAGIAIPADFKYQASASGGYSNLKEVLVNYFNINQTTRSYRETLSVLMGGLIDASEAREKINKKEFKDKIASGTDAERFNSLVILRNAENIELELENKKLREEINNLKGYIEKKFD